MVVVEKENPAIETIYGVYQVWYGFVAFSITKKRREHPDVLNCKFDHDHEAL